MCVLDGRSAYLPAPGSGRYRTFDEARSGYWAADRVRSLADLGG